MAQTKEKQTADEVCAVCEDPECPARRLKAIVEEYRILLAAEVLMFGGRVNHAGRCGAETNALMDLLEHERVREARDDG